MEGVNQVLLNAFFLKLDTPPPRKADNGGLYTFLMLICTDAYNPAALCNT